MNVEWLATQQQIMLAKLRPYAKRRPLKWFVTRIKLRAGRLQPVVLIGRDGLRIGERYGYGRVRTIDLRRHGRKLA